MTLGGWIIMLLSVGSVTTLFIWCIVKVLTSPSESDKLHGYETDLPDKE